MDDVGQEAAIRRSAESGNCSAAQTLVLLDRLTELRQVIESYKAEINQAEAKGYGQGYAMCLHDWRKAIAETTR